MEEVIEFSMKVSDMRDIAKEIVSYKIIEHSQPENTAFIEKIQDMILAACGMLVHSEEPDEMNEEDPEDE